MYQLLFQCVKVIMNPKPPLSCSEKKKCMIITHIATKAVTKSDIF